MTVAKRRRVVFSCTLCRRRKIKCDKTQPVCLRCQKSGVEEGCKYVAYRDEEDASQISASTETFVRAESADTWADEAVEYLKNASVSATPAGSSSLSIAQGKPPRIVDNTAQSISRRQAQGSHMYCPIRPSSPSAESLYKESSGAVLMPTIPLRDQSILRGKGFSTKYYGPTHFASILSGFQDFGKFVMDILNNVSTDKSTNHKVHAQFKITRKAMEEERAKLNHGRTSLLSLLPDQITSEKLAERYFETVEQTYRVLHGPTFWAQFHDFWERPEKSEDSFIVLLLLVMAVASCLVKQESQAFIGRNSRAQHRASDWTKVSESWLSKQSHKHVPMIVFQIRVLLFLAKRVNGIKVKRAWSASGDLARHAMIAGLHREPGEQAKRLSIFEQEMRRRLWATVVELELMTSLEHGFKPSVEDGDWDCEPPSNLHDEKLSSDMNSLPSGEPLQEYTRTSFLTICARSVDVRSRLVAKLNRIRTPPIAFVADGDQRLRQEIANTTSWTRRIQAGDKGLPTLVGFVAKLQLLELLLVLHQNHALSQEDLSGRNNSRAAFREACAMILETYSNMAVQDSVFLSCIRTDNIRAALCMCYDLSEDSLLSSSVTFNRDRAVQLVESALILVEQRLLGVGEGYHDYWLLSCGLSLVQMKQDNAKDRRVHGSTALNRLLKLMDRIIDFQVPNITSTTDQGGSMDFDLPIENQIQSDPFLALDTLLPYEWVDLEPLDFWNAYPNTLPELTPQQCPLAFP